MHYPIFSDLRALRYLSTAGLCAAWGMAVSMPLFLDAPLTRANASEALMAIGASTLGAGLAGLVVAGFFGRPGRIGLALAVLGGVLATGLGSGLGAMVLLEPRIAPAASVVVPAMILNSPLVLMLWAVCLLCVHIGARTLRRIYAA